MTHLATWELLKNEHSQLHSQTYKFANLYFSEIPNDFYAHSWGGVEVGAPALCLIPCMTIYVGPLSLSCPKGKILYFPSVYNFQLVYIPCTK